MYLSLLREYCIESVLGHDHTRMFLNVVTTSLLLNGPNTAVSNGYILCVVWGTMVKMMTLFSHAMVMTSVL